MTTVLPTAISIESFVDWLLRSSVQAAVLVGLILLLRRMAGRAISPSWRQVLWAMVLARLLLPSLPPSRISVFNVLETSKYFFQPQSTVRMDARKPSPQPPMSSINGTYVRVGVLPREGLLPLTIPAYVNPIPWTRSWHPIVFCLWLGGAMLFAARVLIVNLRFGRKVFGSSTHPAPSLLHLLEDCGREMRMTRLPKLLHTDAVDAPSLMGVSRPCLLLPEHLTRELSKSQLRLIFLHELTHLKCRDIAVDWLCTLLHALHWFNPLLWIALAHYKADREMARDAMVLSMTGAVDAQNYGRTILHLLRRARTLRLSPGLVGMADTKARLQQRILMIAQFNPRRTWFSLSGLLLVSLFGCAALTESPSDSNKDAKRLMTPATIPTPTSTAVPLNHSPFYDLDERRMDVNAQAAEAAANAATSEKLDKRSVEINFDSAPLGEVIDYFRRETNVPYIVNWRGLKDLGVDKNTPITARMRSIKFSNALRTVLSDAGAGNTKLNYWIENGAVIVSTDEDKIRSQQHVTRTYYIGDLLVKVPDYSSPLFGTVPSTRLATQPVVERSMTVDEQVQTILNLIKETIDADSWKSIGRIRELSGQLIVTQSADNHVQLQNLLDQLRETRAIQVTTECRFIVVDSAIAEKIGEGLLLSRVKAHGDEKHVAGAFLSQEKVDQFLRIAQESPHTQVLISPRITSFNGQKAYIQVGRQTPYVSGYAVVRNGDGLTRYEPEHGTVDTGIQLTVQSTVSSDRKYVTMNLHPAISHLDAMESKAYPGSPPDQKLLIEHPSTTLREMSTTTSVPDGGTLLLGGFAEADQNSLTPPATNISSPYHDAGDILGKLGPGRKLFVLIKPTIIIQSELRKPQTSFSPDTR